MRLVSAVVALVLLVACGGTTVGPTPAATLDGTRSSQHFVFRYASVDGGDIDAMASGLEGEYGRIVDDLETTAMPTVTVNLYTSHAALEAAVRPAVGAIPAFASGLVTSAREIHMMSPNAPGWGPLARTTSNLVHEFAHCVSLQVNPRFANNPRWLWESVAIFESRQSVDLRSVGYIAALSPPPFETLDSVDNTRVYDIGYSIGEFIVARWGQPALAALIRANGDTAATLGVPLGDFQRQWFAFVRDRYGL
jgi:hypothetical protein